MGSGWKRPLLLSGICVVLFVVLLVTAYWFGPARWADGWAVDGFLKLQRPWLSNLATHVAHLANPIPFALATVVLAAIALIRHRPRHAVAVVALLVGASVVAQSLKVLLAFDRTHEFLGGAQIADAAFPSGHATASMSLAFAAILVAPPAFRAIVGVAGSLFALGVFESVMLLAWHFPSDVMGGFLVATASALATVAALRAAEQRWPERSGRDAARRAFDGLDPAAAFGVAAAFVVGALGAIAIAAGDRAFAFAGRHTVAVAAVVAVAAMSAVLPASVARLGSRRPERYPRRRNRPVVQGSPVKIRRGPATVTG